MTHARLDALRSQRAILLCQVQLLETAIAAEAGMCSFKSLDDRLAASLDAACLANGPCELTLADLHDLPGPPEPQPGQN